MKLMQKLSKKVVLSLLAVAVIATAAISLAVWAYVSGNDEEESGTINIGRGRESTTTLSLSDITDSGGKLVPKGYALEEGEVESIEYTFNVQWLASEDLDGIVPDAPGILTVTVVELITSDDYDLLDEEYREVGELFEITYDFPDEQDYYDIFGEGEKIPVTVTIALVEPATQEQYDLIAGKDIAITFKFTVTPVDTAS